MTTLKEVEEELRDLQSRKCRLLNEVEQIERQIELAGIRRARLSNDAAPISRLPHELLSSILLMARGEQKSRLKSLQVSASHVCGRWRTVAIGTPLLWADIRVLVTFKHATILDAKLDRLDTYLKRSNNRKLDLRMEVNGHIQLEPFLSSLSRHIHRCRRLVFAISNYPSPAHALLSHLSQAEAPVLEHLSIHFPCSRLYAYPKTQFDAILPNILQEGAPLLQFLRVTGTAGHLQPPLSRVTTLHLDGSEMNDLSFRQFRDLLQNTTCLENLSLNQVWVNIVPGDILSISVPHLRSLRVRGPPNFDLQSLLATLPLSQLENCVLSQVEIFRPVECPNVKTLALENCQFVGREVGDLIETFPAIESLTLSAGDPSAIFFALGFPGTPTWWPRLKRLFVFDLPVRGVPDFMTRIRDRQGMDVPLETLYLDRKSRGVLRLKEQLDEVKNLTVVENHEDTAPWPAGLGYEDDDDGFWS
ncbi:hypothetical protein V5O48_008385 [Marasmius crinis-equi]|uniref:F-box domain-containing protein n=1 Tax=Marasmius crinis-equi TaxID=585013 RepID=A0ABR3FE36_9AGAR